MNKKIKFKQGVLIALIVFLMISQLFALAVAGVTTSVFALIPFVKFLIQSVLLFLVIKKKALGYELLIVLSVLTLMSSTNYELIFQGSFTTMSLLMIVAVILQVIMIIFAWQVGKNLYPDRGLFTLGKKDKGKK